MMKFKKRCLLSLLGTVSACLMFVLYHRVDRLGTVSSVHKTVTEPVPRTMKPFAPLPLRYKNPRTGEVGKQFQINQRFLHKVQRDRLQFRSMYITLTPDTLEDYIFVTAASANHFLESMDCIASIQTYQPKKKIIYYDIGLSQQHILKVKEFCNVEYRKFNFHRYPPHVKQLEQYAWKPIIHWEMLQEFPGIVWFDSSVRLGTGNLTGMKEAVLNNDGVVLMSTSGHSVFAAANPLMYKYIPPDYPVIKREEEKEMTTCVLFRTEMIIEEYLYWAVLCSLDVQCIAPPGSKLGCQFAKDRYQTYAHCHRFDQALGNIILLNLLSTDKHNLYAQNQKDIKIARGVTKRYTLKTCPAD